VAREQHLDVLRAPRAEGVERSELDVEPGAGHREAGELPGDDIGEARGGRATTGRERRRGGRELRVERGELGGELRPTVVAAVEREEPVGGLTGPGKDVGDRAAVRARRSSTAASRAGSASRPSA
jgi:hypothetical protein